ncbi:MAG: TonB-dependent receptor, partial [Pedobacter sp.]
GMMARSPKDVLRSMPASSIQKIEVITTPPSKYDSEGLTGIINIITNKKVDNGYNGTLNTRYNFPVGGPGGGGSINLKQGKFGVAAYGGVGNYNNPETETFSDRFTTGGTQTALRQGGRSSSKNRDLYFGSELSFEIDSLNLITSDISYYRGNYNSDGIRTSTLLDQSNAVLQGYQLNSINKNTWDGLDLALNYQLGFKNKPERILTFSYRLSDGKDNYLNNMYLSNLVNYNQPDYLQINNGNSREQTIQVDYVYPIKKLSLEAGIKAIQRDNKSDFESQLEDPSGQYIVDPSQTNKFDNRQRVIGAYNSYQYNTKNWGFKAGVRIEETIIDADFISSATKVQEDYFNIIPTVSINRKFKDMSSINLGYTQRIQRPSIYNLNPFIDKSNPNFESTGNPDLVPVLSNNINFKYSKFKKGSFNIGLSYSFANNTVQYVSIFDPLTNITKSTYLNIGKDRTLGSNFSINYPITKKLNFNVSGNISYLWIEGMVNGRVEKNSGTRGFFYGGVDYKFENGFRVSGNFSYSTPYITLQGKSNSWPYSSLSVNKDIIKDKLSFSASANNFYAKFRDYNSDTSGANFTQNSFGQSYYRSFAVSANWRFGKLKDEIKKNKRGISNDDVSGKS